MRAIIRPFTVPGCRMLRMRIYRWLLRLYPSDVRYAYGREMQQAFGRQVAMWRGCGRVALTLGVMRVVGALLIDAAAERTSTLYSHRSFHGPRTPDLGVVRPPNVSKTEWFSDAPSERD